MKIFNKDVSATKIFNNISTFLVYITMIFIWINQHDNVAKWGVIIMTAMYIILAITYLVKLYYERKLKEVEKADH